MQIKDLPAPVTASKADWLAGTTWLGFTPTGSDRNARVQCQSTITKQYGSGYVIEYITKQFSEPNPGFEHDLSYIAEREAHQALAGRLIAVHKLRATAKSLETILGAEEYQKLQDMWAQDGKRYRWSVAFPIIESYHVVGRPKAEDVLGEEAYRRLYQRSSATLRVLTDSERSLIADLKLEPVVTQNAWIGIEDEFAQAERSEIDSRILRQIGEDLSSGALEGMEEERRAKARKRAAWLAQKFVINRQKRGQLKCDDCGFDPLQVFSQDLVRPRSLLDVHHKHPLDEGVRYTTIADFALLCPTCHRIEHHRLKLQQNGTAVS